MQNYYSTRQWNFSFCCFFSHVILQKLLLSICPSACGPGAAERHLCFSGRAALAASLLCTHADRKRKRAHPSARADFSGRACCCSATEGAVPESDCGRRVAEAVRAAGPVGLLALCSAGTRCFRPSRPPCERELRGTPLRRPGDRNAPHSRRSGGVSVCAQPGARALAPAAAAHLSRHARATKRGLQS